MVDAACGHGLRAVAVNRLDAVAVRVEQEAAVVVGAVDRAGAGRAVVEVAGRHPRAPEGVHRLTARRTEADVEATGQGVRTIGGADRPVLPLDEPGVRVARLDAQHGEDRPVEALGRGQVRDGDPDVVEHADKATGGSHVRQMLPGRGLQTRM